MQTSEQQRAVLVLGDTLVLSPRCFGGAVTVVASELSALRGSLVKANRSALPQHLVILIHILARTCQASEQVA